MAEEKWKQEVGEGVGCFIQAAAFALVLVALSYVGCLR